MESTKYRIHFQLNSVKTLTLANILLTQKKKFLADTNSGLSNHSRLAHVLLIRIEHQCLLSTK